MSTVNKGMVLKENDKTVYYKENKRNESNEHYNKETVKSDMTTDLIKVTLQMIQLLEDQGLKVIGVENFEMN
jgi:hypothetical protein